MKRTSTALILLLLSSCTEPPAVVATLPGPTEVRSATRHCKWGTPSEGAMYEGDLTVEEQNNVAAAGFGRNGFYFRCE